MQRRAGLKGHAGNVIEFHLTVILQLVQGVDVHLVFQLLDEALHVVGRMAQRVTAAHLQVGVGTEPTDHRLDLLAAFRWVVLLDDHVAAADVDLVLERDRHGHRGIGLLHVTVNVVDALHPGLETARHHRHRVARLEHPTGHPPRVAPEIMPLVAVRPNDPLHREPGVHMVMLIADVHRLERVKQRAAVIPIHVRGPLNNVVAQ